MKYILILCMAVAGCAMTGERREKFASLQARAKSVCEVMADPNSRIGQHILVHGIFFSEPNRRVLYDERCPGSTFKVSHAMAVDGDPRAEAIVERFRKLHPTVRIPVVYSGIFRGRSIIQGCTTPSCSRYSLEEARLLAASPHRVR